MNIANLLSVLHLVLLPFLLYFVWIREPLFTLLAIAILLLSVLMDMAGKLMRRKKMSASFLHPFSDKIVVLALLFVFVLQGIFSGVILGIFLLRDIIISMIRMNASRDDVVIPGEWYGKMITVLQFILVFMILAKTVFLPLQGALAFVISIFTAAALVLGVVSVAHYGYVYVKGLRTRKQLGTIVEKEPMIILANKRSGGYRDKYRRHLLKIFATRRNASIHYLSGKNIFHRIEKKIGKTKHVIIAGGDGSFEAALNNRVLQERSLGFFPLGTGNAFYSYFYKGKRFEYLRSRFKFRETLLDVVEVEWEKGKRNTLFLSAGVDGEVVHAITRKERHSFPDYFSAAAKVAFGKNMQYDLTCTVDGHKYHWENAINLILGKVSYIGFGMRSLLGEIKEDDDTILGMACVNTHAPFFNKALRVWAIFLTQLGLAKAPLISLRGKEFMVESKKPFPIQAGGEFLGYSKWMRVKVKRKQKVLLI
ncbi:MAG TPA: CDP-alcohol phosphatidyltransferase family protein [Candidatus Nanoarchaeia archaeon]|nr:CDP-alcohol phosphatidyltransferase family protein [Candidatus Nanoarchaeia archaeon]